jgi:hypothetical protein
LKTGNFFTEIPIFIFSFQENIWFAQDISKVGRCGGIFLAAAGLLGKVLRRGG